MKNSIVRYMQSGVSMSSTIQHVITNKQDSPVSWQKKKTHEQATIPQTYVKNLYLGEY